MSNTLNQRLTPGFTIYQDSTATPSGPQINQNNQFVLQPSGSAMNSQSQHVALPREAAGFYHPRPISIACGQENAMVVAPVEYKFDVNAWMAENTVPGAPMTISGLTPQQLQFAQNTTCVSLGPPATISKTPYGYQVDGIWHAGHLQQAVRQCQARPSPDITPFWTTHGLQAQDAGFRAGNGIPGTVWPTPAVGMTMHIPTIEVAAQHGMHIQYVSPTGQIQWIWNGYQ